MRLYHASSVCSDIILKDDFVFDINHSGTLKNGDNQAAGIHFSESKSFADDYRVDFGCLVSAEVNVANFPDFYEMADVSVYREIMEEFIGENRLIELTDEIEDNLKEDYEEYFDVYDRLTNALIFYDQDLWEDLDRNYELTKDMKKELDFILSNSFELEDNLTHEKCYEMLAATLGGRVKASKSLIEKDVHGFKYKWPKNDENNPTNYCVMNSGNIKRLSVEIKSKLTNRKGLKI